MNHVCEICKGEGMVMAKDADRRFTAQFCSCAAGQKRKHNWIAYEDRVLKAARSRRAKPERGYSASDYKGGAAGNGERWPGEDEEEQEEVGF